MVCMTDFMSAATSWQCGISVDSSSSRPHASSFRRRLVSTASKRDMEEEEDENEDGDVCDEDEKEEGVA